jgi:virulence-associated protein VagC
MVHSTVFKTNRSQAVRLPKAVALPDSVKQVEVVKQGKGRLILPADTVYRLAEVSTVIEAGDNGGDVVIHRFWASEATQRRRGRLP